MAADTVTITAQTRVVTQNGESAGICGKLGDRLSGMISSMLYPLRLIVLPLGLRLPTFPCPPVEGLQPSLARHAGSYSPTTMYKPAVQRMSLLPKRPVPTWH